MKAKFVYESIDNIFKPKSEEKILSSLENSDLSPDELLIQCSAGGFLQGVKKALEMGADVHASNDWALRYASYYGHYKIVELLLKNGANVHANNDEALKWASKNSHIDVVKLLKKYINK